MLLIPCNGTATEIKSTPFSVEVAHIASAVEKQVVTINLQANDTIVSSDLTVAENAYAEIEKISDSEYQLTITELYLAQELLVQVTAVNNKGEQDSANTNFSLLINKLQTLNLANEKIQDDE